MSMRGEFTTGRIISGASQSWSSARCSQQKVFSRSYMQKVQIQLASSPQTSHSQSGASVWLNRRTVSPTARPWRSSTTRSVNSVEVGGSAEVVSMPEAGALVEDLAELDLHGALVGIREHAERLISISARDRVGGPTDLVSAEVAVAFQLLFSQEVVRLFEGGSRLHLHLHIHSVDGRISVLDPQTKNPRGLSTGRFVLGQTALQVTRHSRFISTLTAEVADTI
jgi:hypothetical protein